MKVIKSYNIVDFEPWSGAVDTWNTIKEQNKIEALEFLLTDLYPNGIDETKLNDLLWFEDEWLNEMLDLGMEF